MTPIDIHHGATLDYYDKAVGNLLDRWQPMADWLNARARAGLEPYSKSTLSRTAPRLRVLDRMGRQFEGVNFASQDYLNLSTHPEVLRAVASALDVYGVHSAGSAALMGLTDAALRLERRIASFVGLSDATVFPTGWEPVLVSSERWSARPTTSSWTCWPMPVFRKGPRFRRAICTGTHIARMRRYGAASNASAMRSRMQESWL